jgi:hypothetical protein
MALSLVGIQDFCHKKTNGFSLSKAISSKNPKEKKILSLEENPFLPSILNQPFHFLEKGLQCYVFLSEDKQYVLKLIRWQKLEPSLFNDFSSWTRKTNIQKQKKQQQDLTSYQIAWKALQKETGLIFLHLEKTKGLNLSLHLYDPILVRHIVPADDIEFIVQKKADPFLPYFEKHRTSIETLYPFFSELAEILRSRLKKGISDSDISLQYNMGIVEGNPILFDIGNLVQKEPEDCPSKEALEYEARLILSWLSQESPDLEIFFRKALYNENLPP